MPKLYKLITSAQELKALHAAAKAEGNLEVGVSNAQRLYAWDEDKNSLRTISPDEAAKRLGLTLAQVNQIIETKGAVEFIDAIERDLEEPPHQDLIDEIDLVQNATVNTADFNLRYAKASSVHSPQFINESPQTPAPEPAPEPEAPAQTPEPVPAPVEPASDHKNALKREIFEDIRELIIKIEKLFE